MNHVLADFIDQYKGKIEECLAQYTEGINAPAPLKEAMAYSLLGGGKRIRPFFILATIDALGGHVEDGLPAACALEMIHTYSLIHDDLPAMDDDDYRRGKLTNHKVFGEGLAILAGDALLTQAFFLLADARTVYSCEQRVEMIRELALRAGPAGMVAGQTADILSEKKTLTLDQITQMHQRKTGDLLVCAIRLGCIIAKASEEQKHHLSQYAQAIGLAFQIQDDILDEIGDEEKLGKTTGSDRHNQKSTYVTFLGLDGARQELMKRVIEAKQALHQAGVKRELLLASLAEYVVSREW